MDLGFLYPLLGRFSNSCPKATEVLLRALARVLHRGKMGKRIRTAMETAGVDSGLARDNILYVLRLVRDFLYIRFHPDPWGILRERVVIENLDALGQWVASGQGVILLALHKGNFLWALARLAREIPINVVLRKFKDPWLEDRLEETLLLAGIKGIWPEGGTLKVRDALKGGEAVVYLIDQYFLELSRREKAFGLYRALSLFARKLNTPLVPLVLRHEGTKTIVRVLEPMAPSEDGIKAWLQREIYNDPHLWLWWYRLGKIKEGGRWPSIWTRRADTIPKRPSG